jgi:pSer/pThr/pTyr-binding forkhead associated (FHA) protein
MTASCGPALVVVAPNGAERVFLLGGSEAYIGRSEQCSIVLDGSAASRRHARVRFDAGGASIEDLGSRNGTLVNGAKIAAPVRLAHGDTIEISGTTLHFLDPPRAPKPEDAEREQGTLLTEAFVSGTIAETLVANPSALDSAEAESLLLRVVVPRCAGPRVVVRDATGASREVPLTASETLVGRAADCAVQLADPAVSATHARVVAADGAGRAVEDLASRSGTFVNGIRVARQRLREGDIVRMGASSLLYKDDAADTQVSTQRTRPVVIVPGFAGSELYAGGERLWPNLRRLLTLPERRLADYWGDVEVRKVIREVAIVPGLFKLESFGRLVAFLVEQLGYTPGENLLEFPYDWRQDNRTTARELARAIARWRAGRSEPTEKVVLLAHSMGGLIARHYIARAGGAETVERAIFLGTPHAGSSRSLLVALAGEQERPLGLAFGKLHVVLRNLPSLYQLLPAYPLAFYEDGGRLDPFASDEWVVSVCRPHLESALTFRRELDEVPLGAGPAVTSVFGYGRKTLARLRLARRSAGIQVVAEEFEAAGDGTVLESSAVLAGSEIHPVEQEHGVLHADRDVLRRIRFELVERDGSRDALL